MTKTTRAAFQASLPTALPDNSTGLIAPSADRDLRADLSDSVPFFAEDVGGKGGWGSTAYDAGTKSGGTTFTPDPLVNVKQYAVNGGAHPLAPPAIDCSMTIRYTNNASAGAITFPGWTVADTGDLTTTNGHKFFFIIERCAGDSWLFVKALQ